MAKALGEIPAMGVGFTEFDFLPCLVQTLKVAFGLE